MAERVVPEQLLRESKKILFITHLAIGDFTYLQNFFKAFKQAHPHLAVDLWIDERRRTWKFWRWKYLKNYALFDWVKSCSFFNKIYMENYTPRLLKKSISLAKHEQYDIIVSLSTLDVYGYTKLALAIHPHAFIVAHNKTHRRYQFLKKSVQKKINGSFGYTLQPGDHITDVYAAWLDQLFGIHLPKQDRKPFVNIPRVWLIHAKLQLLKWGISHKENRFTRVIFINAYAKDTKRSWPLENVFDLIRTIKQQDLWLDIAYIINAPPEHMDAARKMAYHYSLSNTHITSANLNFFQLPALISISDLVISVETSVMHLATAFDIPVVALMRAKNPEWRPWDSENVTLINCQNRTSWIRNIPLEVVTQAIAQHPALKTVYNTDK